MTARMVVMMTPANKRELERRAREVGLTPSEFMRRASESYDPSADEALLEAFLVEFEANNRAMSTKLRETADQIEATLAKMDARKAEQEAELTALRGEMAAMYAE